MASTYHVQVPPVNLVHAEILAVTSAMRKNQRWASVSYNAFSYSPSVAARLAAANLVGNVSNGSLNGESSGAQLGTQSSSNVNRHDHIGQGNASNSSRTLAGSSTGSVVKQQAAAATAAPISTASSLMGGFMALKLDLREVRDVTQLDALILLHPFLEVVRSPETSGPITATALSSIDKFITYGILNEQSPNLFLAMAQLSTAATHCKFEASDSVSDEIVLLKILDVLRNCLTGALGNVLSDESVCEMMETGLSMCCQMRLSEMLRKSAERTMQAMVAAVFSRLQHLPLEEVAAPDTLASSLSLEDAYGQDANGVRMAAPDPRSAQLHNDKASEGESSVSLPPINPLAPDSGVKHDEVLDPESSLPLEDDDLVDMQPYGLASIQELLRVLVSLLNPHDQQHTDSMRLMALGLLNIAFEVAGQSIGRFPSLRTMVADHLCKHLFQLARYDNTYILFSALRIICNIFDTMQPHLKLQQELFLSFLLDRLVLAPSAIGTSGAVRSKADVEAHLDATTWMANVLEVTRDRSTGSTLGAGATGSISGQGAALATGTASGGRSTPIGRDRERSERDRESRGSTEAKELMLEILSNFGRGRHSMADYWVNYDCNVEGEDLFERLIRFLSRGVFPTYLGAQYQQDNSQLLCLDTVLEFVGQMAARLDEPVATRKGSPDATELAATKSHKQILLQGAAEFNLKPKVGLKFLEDHGIIYSDPGISREESLARFFKTTPRLDKKLLGDFISRPDQIEVLRAFMRLMDFGGKIICDAMRELLEAFRLPGESQQIARITEVFAEVYFETKPPEIKSQDAVYILAYSVIMLNTDLHNPQVRKRMDITAYSRNLRGVNDGQDFDPEYLKSIYDSIRKREIVLPEEHQNQVGFEYGWKELLRRTRQAGPFLVVQSNEFDRGMFAVAWKPVVSSIAYAFANFQDDFMVQRTIAGLNECAALAARYNMPEVLDFLIASLSRVTGLVLATPTTEVGNFPVVDIEPGQKITVSPMAVRFGNNVKAQLAAVVLFTIANTNANSIKDGWAQIFEILQTLFVHSLLPPSLLAMEEFLSGQSVIPLKPHSTPAPKEERRSDGGLLSTLSSYLLSPYGGETPGNDYSDEDVETTLSAVDAIASCRIEDLYGQLLQLRDGALVAPVQALVDLGQKLTIDRLRPRAGSISTPNSPQINISTARVQLPYDPSASLLLEMVTSVVSRAEDSIQELWPIVFDFLTKLLSAASSFSILFNERVVASVLKLSSIVIKQDELRDSTFLALDMLRSLPPPVLASVAEPLMAGMARLFAEGADRIESETEWNLIFALFQATIQQEEAAKISFELMRQLAAGKKYDKVKLGPNNYSRFLHVLVAFATAPTSASQQQQQNMIQASADRPMDDPVYQRGRLVVDILKSTQDALPSLIAESTLSATRAWEASWIPLLSAYSQLCLSSSRELRQIAISSMQRTLVAREILDNSNVDFTTIFEKVFFPMLEELLKPQVFRRDPEGMGETRLRASALLCKIFLSYLTQLSERQGMETLTNLWLRILGYQDRFMHSGRRDQMASLGAGLDNPFFEAVPESLKNVLLVMNEAGFLRPPHDPQRTAEHAALWNATFDRIQPFLPDLEHELFPPPKVPVPFSSSAPPLPAGTSSVSEVATPSQSRPQVPNGETNGHKAQ
ncbi:GDP/GTP exchange factor for ARF [Microbotryomycetes sp. JL221]|nr:GDP/GTP exchange factor for ARF [Microbotryomycetes sp. JL221]